MKKKSTIWVAIVFVLLAALLVKIGFFSKQSDNEKSKKEKPQKKVAGIIAKSSLLIDEISVSGSLQAFEMVDLKNEVAGRVVSINLPEGKFVKSGTLLVKLFDDDLQSTLKKLQSQLSIQQEIYKRQSELLKVNGISQNDYEMTGLQLNSLKADIEVEKTMIRKTEVRAPFDGVIGLRNVSVGAIVTPSTLLATIRTVNKLKLDFFVPEKYSSELKAGMKVKFTMSNGTKLYDATVMATEEGIDDATRNMKVRAIVNSQSKELISGGFANVQLRLNQKTDAILIPTQAIIPQEENKIVIVSNHGKAKFIKVKTGIRKSSTVEITVGIQAGDTIVTSGLLFLKEGAKLTFSTVK